MNPYQFSRKVYNVAAFLGGLLFLVCLMAYGQENDGKHPTVCALTAPSHSKLMAEYSEDKEAQKCYQWASSNHYLVASRLGNIYGTGGNEELIALYIFVRDSGINIRTYHLFTDEKHHIMVVLFPGQVLDRSLAEFFKK